MTVLENADRGNGFPESFEVPSRRITPADIEGSLNLHQGEIEIIYPAEPEYDFVEVRWHGALNLHGTFMLPDDLFGILAPMQMRQSKARELLLGSHQPRPDPIVILENDKHTVRVNIFAGALCEEAITLAALGSAGTFLPNERSIYQTALQRIFQPVSLRKERFTRAALHLKHRARLFRDQEDVIATFDTLGGIGRLLDYENRNHGQFFSGRRIDVACATAQGLTVMALEADRFGLPIEVNVGYLAFGLSEGIGAEQAHKNYVMFAPFPEFRDLPTELLFVVGDMGQAAGRVDGLPWDTLRSDDHGLTEGTDPYSRSVAVNLSQEGSLLVGYANGGLLMKALATHAHRKGIITHAQPATIMAVAKRQDRLDGFGVNIGGLIYPLRRYIKAWQ